MGDLEIKEAVEEMVEKRVDFEERECSRVVKTHFTEKERLTIGDQISNAIRNLSDVQSDLKSVKASYDGRIKAFETEVQNLAQKLNTGWEMRRQDCTETKDYRVGRVTVYVKNTGEIVEERAMTFEERQMKLPISPGDTVEVFTGPKPEHPEDIPIGEMVFKAGQAPDLPLHDAPNEPETTLGESSVSVEGVGEGMFDDHVAEKPEISQENELPDDTHPFYSDREPLEIEKPTPKRGKKSLKLE